MHFPAELSGVSVMGVPHRELHIWVWAPAPLSLTRNRQWLQDRPPAAAEWMKLLCRLYRAFPLSSTQANLPLIWISSHRMFLWWRTWTPQQGLPRDTITGVARGISSGEVTERCFLLFCQRTCTKEQSFGSHVPLTLSTCWGALALKHTRAATHLAGRLKTIPRHLGFANLIPTTDKT